MSILLFERVFENTLEDGSMERKHLTFPRFKSFETGRETTNNVRSCFRTTTVCQFQSAKNKLVENL